MISSYSLKNFYYYYLNLITKFYCKDISLIFLLKNILILLLLVK